MIGRRGRIGRVDICSIYFGRVDNLILIFVG